MVVMMLVVAMMNVATVRATMTTATASMGIMMTMKLVDHNVDDGDDDRSCDYVENEDDAYDDDGGGDDGVDEDDGDGDGN